MGESSRLTVMNAALDRIEEVLQEAELPDKGTEKSRRFLLNPKYSLMMLPLPMTRRTPEEYQLRLT